MCFILTLALPPVAVFVLVLIIRFNGAGQASKSWGILLSNLLTAFAFAFVAGVLGAVLADAIHIVDLLAMDIPLSHMGGLGRRDIIFIAGWTAGILFMLFGSLYVLIWVGYRFRDSSPTQGQSQIR